MEREILLLGDPRLYEVCEAVKQEELEELRPVFEDLFDYIKAIRRDDVCHDRFTFCNGSRLVQCDDFSPSCRLQRCCGLE